MKKIRNTILFSLIFTPSLIFAYSNIDVDISAQGVISPFSVSCTGTNATALLISKDYPFSHSVEAYMRRPCINGVVTFDSFDLNSYVLYLTTGETLPLTYFFWMPQKLVVKDTTNVRAFDAPLYRIVINLYSDFNNFDTIVESPDDITFPTLAVSQGFDFDGVSWKKHGALVGNSSVLFLPGIESSRLYRQKRPDEGSGELRLWEPGNIIPGGLRDLSSLMLDENGKAIPPLLPEYNVYARDVIDEAYGTFNIYKSFLDSLEKLKSVDHSIADYSAVPYDWRFSLDDTLGNGTKSGLNISYLSPSVDPYIISELRRLASGSQNGKVTIIAHSMGGLVAKALVKRLQDSGDPLLSKIDKIIFVAVPQLGTPSTIPALLHGYDQSIPAQFASFDLNPQEARNLGHNMPSAYNLLPSAKYFESIQTPVVTFASDLTDWASRYGATTTSEVSLRNFLADTYGRVASDASDTNTPDSLRSNLLTQSEGAHNYLDNWTPPTGLKVIEIAGWGIPTTISGVRYIKDGGGIKPEAITTIDGDGTVVAPSALYSNGVGVDRYWIDEGLWNKKHSRPGPLGLKHKDILEITDLIGLIKNTINNQSPSNSQYLSTSTPNNPGTHLVYSLHSPLTLDAYDNIGNHTGISTSTGLIEENIPGSYYLKFGDIKYIFTDTDLPIHIFMNGYANGTFTFNIEELQGDSYLSNVTFKDIPTTSSTKVSIDTQTDINSVSPMRVDLNGDSTIDFSIGPKINDTVYAPYRFDGFLQPINDTAHQTGQQLSVFKAGSTVPVKFQIKKWDGTIIQSINSPISLTPQKGAAMSASIDESVYADQGTTGTTFKWDSTNQQYIYNWSTKGLVPGYWYKISVKLDDGSIYSVTIGLK